MGKFARRRAARRAEKAALLVQREERRQAQAVAVKRWAEAWIERVREDRAAKGRGIDRVPEHLRLEQERQYVVEHYEPPFTPYVNPARDKKRGARLRKELS